MRDPTERFLKAGDDAKTLDHILREVDRCVKGFLVRVLFLLWLKLGTH